MLLLFQQNENTSKTCTLERVKNTCAYSAFGESNQYLAQITIDPNAPVELFKQVFVRDKLGRITTKTETVAGTTTAYSYGYDLAGRLETVSTNGVLSKTFGFDANSNRTSLITSAGTITGVADAQDRLLSYGSNVYTYAANGELTTKTKAGVVRSFAYDVMGNLTSVSEPTTLNLKYGFDAQNRRISRVKNNVITHSWLYLDQLRIAAELNADGSLKQQFAYGEKMNVPSVILRPEQNGTVLYRVISDHLGSVRLVVNSETGAVAQRMRYDEYGQVLEDTNPGFQPFGYAGGLYDPDTGLVRFGARDYDPEIGRWLAKDPIRFGDNSWNLYNYVDSDPINFFDNTGFSKVNGQRNIGGSDPLKPRDWRSRTADQLNKLLEEVQKVLDDPKANPKRKLELKGFKKVVKRSMNRSLFPPLVYDICLDVAAQECRNHDMQACRVFQDMGGDPGDYQIEFFTLPEA